MPRLNASQKFISICAKFCETDNKAGTRHFFYSLVQGIVICCDVIALQRLSQTLYCDIIGILGDVLRVKPYHEVPGESYIIFPSIF